RNLVTVKLATGTTPTASAQACGPPSSLTSSAAAPAERVSFHSSAGRTTSSSASSVTMPCCCPATATASARASSPVSACIRASHQWCGCTSVSSGCVARPSSTTTPVLASHSTILQDCVDESIPATSVMPRSCLPEPAD